MKKPLLLTSFIVVCIFFSGCTAALKHHFVLDNERHITSQKRSPAKVGKLRGNVLLKMLKMNFLLRKDGSLEFYMSLGQLAKTKGTSKGTWSRKGSQYTLIIKKLANGKKVHQVTKCQQEGDKLTCIQAHRKRKIFLKRKPLEE